LVTYLKHLRGDDEVSLVWLNHRFNGAPAGSLSLSSSSRQFLPAHARMAAGLHASDQKKE
jgi:hypothetical protein